MATEKRPLEARWPEVSKILDAVLELPTEERASFIDREIGDDPELRHLVERLLEADQQGSHFLGASAQKLATSLLEHTPEAIAKRLGRYEILGRLGSGGMGEVFEAEDRQLRRRVAIKVLAATEALNEKGRKRFLREARAASSVDHPNICTVHDIGETDEHLYIVMSCYDGETLEARLRRGPLVVEEALDIAKQVTRGLACAHDAGVIHRDIKPANVVLPREGPVKILDFGIAKMLGETRLTRTDAAPGTLAYMAPEQIEGGDADVRADVWSVGVLLYQMLSGRLPFEQSGLGATVHAILHGTPAPLAAQGLAPGVETVVATALAKSPDDRYPNAHALLEALEDPASQVQAKPVALSLGSSGRPPTTWGLPTASRRALWITSLLLGALLLAWFLSSRLGPAPDAKAVEAVVVDPFENRSVDDALAWMGPAIASMLSCDLAQLEDLEVLSGCGLADGGTEPTSVVAETREDSELRRIRGSYLASSGRLRLDVAIVDARESVIQNKVLQRDAEQVVQLVADASSFVRQALGISEPGETWLANEAMTTSSLEAWRHYQDALAFNHAGDLGEARQAFEAAIGEDPEFALALADFGLFFISRGDSGRARKYLDRAMTQGHRLPTIHRDRIQAEVLASSWEGYAAAVEIFERLVAHHPSRSPERNHLAAIHGWLENYSAAAALYDGLIEEGTDHYATYESAASVHVALGQFDRAHQVLDRVPAAFAEHWKLRWKRGWVWLEQGRWEEAATALGETLAIPSAGFLSRYELWRLAIVQQRWDRALALATDMVDSATRDGGVAVFEAWWGEVAMARTHLFVGRAEAAVDAYARATDVASGSPQGALSLCMAAELALALGDPSSARAFLLSAREWGDQQWPWLQATAQLALAEERLGQVAASMRALEALAQRALNADNAPELRLSERFAGLLAMERDDTAGAVVSLTSAASRLPPRGIEFHDHHLPDHAAIWFELGVAEQRAGRAAEARAWFERVLTQDVQMVQAPLAWVRAHFRLATVLHQEGQLDVAATRYGQFLALRPPNGLDADLVERARAALDEILASS